MNKKIKHMGMTLTEEEHERWHKEHSEITPEQHEAWMKKMGITKEEDEEWHKKNKTPQKTQREAGLQQINPFAVGGGFLEYCVKQGWLIQEGKGRNAKYYATEKGKKKLKNLVWSFKKSK